MEKPTAVVVDERSELLHLWPAARGPRWALGHRTPPRRLGRHL